MCNFSKALGGSYVVSASEMRVASVWTVLDRRVRGRNPATPPSTVSTHFRPFSTLFHRFRLGRTVRSCAPLRTNAESRDAWSQERNHSKKRNFQGVGWRVERFMKFSGEGKLNTRSNPCPFKVWTTASLGGTHILWTYSIRCALWLLELFFEIHNSLSNSEFEMSEIHSSQRRFLCCSGRRSSGADCWEDAEDLWPHSSLRPAMVGVWFEMCRINLSTSTVAPDASSHLEIWHRKGELDCHGQTWKRRSANRMLLRI